MNKEIAESLASKKLAELEQKIGLPISLYKAETIETKLAWVFFYNSDEFIKTGKFSAQLLGNGPIIVMKKDGGVSSCGSHPSIDEILLSLE